MKILGLSLGETATAALLIDGQIVACASEERFSRKKNDETFPVKAIQFCFQQAGISGVELDEVAIASLGHDIWHRLTHHYSSFSIADHIEEQHKYWKPTLYEGKQIAWHKLYQDRWDLNQFPGNWKELISSLSEQYYSSEEDTKKVHRFLIDAVHRATGVDRSKVVFIDHHTGHSAYAYWASPIRDSKTAVLTMDAWGDGVSATVSVPDGKSLKRIKAIDHKEFRLARMYRYITLLLGMKPNEHEYKVMGLAPYAKPKTYEKALQVFRNTMYVDGLDFKYKENPKDMYFYFKEKLEGIRFDGIAGALQKYSEEIITEWVKNVLKFTGSTSVVFSGGVAMNIKAMQCVSELNEVKNLFVPPSGGDESLAIGVCYHLASAKYGAEQSQLNTAYLGPDVDQNDIKNIIKTINEEKLPYNVKENVTAKDVAKLLASGRVIGRCVDRMEFGARSLGNRSILADPRSYQTIQVINEKIKNRDFWMPFAPAVLAKGSERYILNPKKLSSPFMTLAFNTTPLGAEKIVAGTHPADKTARAQLVDDKSSKGFCELIEAFEHETGVGALLNTSFNLHGEPVVCTASDAFRVFRLSGIDDLLIGNVLVSKQ